MAAPERTVHCTDGVQWLLDNPLPADHAVLTSMPDTSELSRLSFAQWEQWFSDTAALIVRSTAPGSAAIFYQTDIKREGTWVDKGYLVQRGAYAAGGKLLWHKIVCRAPAGTATFGRPAYAHLLCFSRGLLADPGKSTADVLPRLGAMTWARAMGLEAVEHALRWLSANTTARVLVDPFCGVGTALAAANAHGLAAIGVELSPKRAQKARELVLP